MRIRFLTDHRVQQGDGNGPFYEKGKIYDFTGFSPETYAAKYIRVGLAEEVAPPARAVEMFHDRVVLMVFDKSVLDEDDVANATVIVWGHAPEAQLKPIGPRAFLTPGWITARGGPHVAVVEQAGTAIVVTGRPPAPAACCGPPTAGAAASPRRSRRR